ncbi:flagellar biosynthetic protein FliQ [Pseudoalteromonas marina]|uniref:Flagellar biosynthetic protein FliQ n=1 Tax=Pseudoalteromonas marina TaxID=267375 RepID=A0ABT9FC14_9GAMM|nr:flagellar biosynthetic protein FliQ [Pseudoalteromonas marina]MDP2564327.1 flagellar biosynthetic protein FliQ [Pseudoalteromonas marina]
MGDQVTFILVEAAWVLLNFICIIMLPSLFVGLIVGVFQAATQIQEMTLSFIPKIFSLVFVLIYFGSDMSQMWLGFTKKITAMIMDL